MRSHIALVALIGVAACGRKQQAPPPPPPPIVVSIANNNAAQLQPQRYVDFHFPLPARTCSITGRIEGAPGANNDFEAFIMNDDHFRTWTATAKASGIQSGRKVVWSINETVRGPGQWHLIVSNAFSASTTKTVTVSAKAVCPS